MKLRHTCALFAFVFVAFGTCPSLAASHHHHHHNNDCGQGNSRFVCEEISVDGITAQRYVQLLEQAHESIEVESDGNFVQRWRDKFRIRQMMLNAYRWYSMHKGRPEVANAAANVTSLLLVSHTIETIGGFALAGMGAEQGGLAGLTLSALGVSISVPGVEPICYLVVAAYAKWPLTIDRWLTYPRIVVVRGLQKAANVAGFSEVELKEAIDSYLKERFLKQLKARSNSYDLRIRGGSAEFTLFGPELDEEIELRMLPQEDGTQGLASVHFSEAAMALTPAQVKKLLKPFGMNVRSMVVEIAEHAARGTLDELKGRSYVNDVRASGGVAVELQPGAFPFYSMDESDCEGSLLSPGEP